MKKIDLSGVWSLTCSKAGFQAIPAQIPGENCSALIDAGIVPDPYIGLNENELQWVRDHDWTWSRKFYADAGFLKHKRIWLNIDSLDTVGEIRINGKTAASGENMFARLRVDVKEFLHEGENSIEVIITAIEKYIAEVSEKLPVKVGIPLTFDRHIPGINLIRKIQCQGGWDWGPCIPASGMYGTVALEGSNGARIEHVYTEQKHQPDLCILKVFTEIDSDYNGTQEIKFAFNGEEKTVSAVLAQGMNIVSTSFEVKNPELWYPAGYGDQPLYDLEVETDSCFIRKKIGLRDLQIVSHPDEHGICLYFKVNGTAVFCKGADWIPIDARPQTYSRERYDRLLSDAVKANMNALRVWGGGLYENEDFYELCDEKGILLWHDCMFACAHYPSTEEFISLINAEINYQVKRLRDHACIALWCGDNECASFLRNVSHDNLELILNYDRFNQAVGKAVRAADDTRVFWPTSPCNSQYDISGWHDDSKGDMHYWKVWHSGSNFEAYYDVVPRFCSEFGYQAFPTQNMVDFYTQGKQRNVTSPVMEHHQRNRGGNSKIVEMFTRYFRMPSTFEDFIYLSQVQQAVAIKSGVEFWRTLKPVCMGTIYWQLNDNWPVASWSSIDFSGSWKQLHYHARRFYSPVLAAALRKTPDTVEFRMSSDLGTAVTGELEYYLYKVTGELVRKQSISVSLEPYEAAILKTVPLAELTPTPYEDFLFIRFCGESDGKEIDFTNECFLAKYKEYQLEQPQISSRIFCDADGILYLELSSDKPAFYVFAEFKGVKTVLSDNSFTLLPGVPRVLKIETGEKKSPEELEKLLSIRHLRSSYTE